ncbi:MAG TPA: CHC2 zinc finger domain-containing protein, partial [Solirubrobacteraceae bacterium]|nr:CHC2 zinc finger domain-containing protein [Solirubrobacteraceae bacterium]
PTVLRAKAGSVPRVVRGELERQLRAIPSARYAYVLAGAKPNRAGKILCPFHAESDPSLQLYADGSFYCFGSGCRRGGSIFDFAGHLWGITPRGTGFTELRDRLSDRFDLERAACS